MTIASTGRSCAAAGTQIDELDLERAGDACRGGSEEGKQAVVVAAAIAEPPAGEIERDARHQHEVDGVAGNARSIGQRLGNPLGTRRDVALRIGDRVELEHARRHVDARDRHGLAGGERCAHQRQRVPFAAGTGNVINTARAATNSGSAATRAAIAAEAAARIAGIEGVAPVEHLHAAARRFASRSAAPCVGSVTPLAAGRGHRSMVTHRRGRPPRRSDAPRAKPL